MGVIQRTSSPQRETWWYVTLVGEVGLMIAIPMTVSGLAGRWIDRQLATAPWATLGFLVVGTIISILNFATVIRKIWMR